MKKGLSLVLLMAMILLSLSGCGGDTRQEAPANGQQQEQTPAADPAADPAAGSATWIFGCVNSDDHPSSITTYEFAEAMKEATDGRVTFEVYTNGTLGSETEMQEMVRANTIQIVASNVATVPVYVDTIGVFTLPYVFHSWEDEYDYLNNSEKAKELWAELEELASLKYVGVTLNGSRCISTKGVMVKSPSDLNGVKIRCMEAPVWQDIISSLGATPVPIAYNELYSAMQTGVVQGQDNPISNVYSQKFYEVQDYVFKTEHCYNATGYFCNPDAWNTMSAEDQETFMRLWDEIMVGRYNEMMDEYYEEAETACEAGGCEIIEQDQLDMQAFYDSAAEMVEEKYMSDGKYASIIEDIRTTYHY